MRISSPHLPADTADRLLAGEFGAHRVGLVLSAAARPGAGHELAGEADARQAFRAGPRTCTAPPAPGRPRIRAMRTVLTAKVVGAAAVTLTAGGVAVAATGPMGGPPGSVAETTTPDVPTNTVPDAPDAQRPPAGQQPPPGAVPPGAARPCPVPAPANGASIADLVRGCWWANGIDLDELRGYSSGNGRDRAHRPDVPPGSGPGAGPRGPQHPAGQHPAGQGSAGHDSAGHDSAGQGSAGQGSAGQPGHAGVSGPRDPRGDAAEPAAAPNQGFADSPSAAPPATAGTRPTDGGGHGRSPRHGPSRGGGPVGAADGSSAAPAPNPRHAPPGHRS